MHRRPQQEVGEKCGQDARVRFALEYYSSLRPHQGFGGATPAEVYFDETPAMEAAVPPPRKCEATSTGGEPLPLDEVFLDPERRMPVLVPARKAA